MRSKSIDDYIFFGTALRFLQDADSGWNVHADLYVLWNIDAFLERLEEFDLVVTQRAAYQLERFREELASTPTDHKLSASEAERLREIMTTLRPTLIAEAAGKVAFIASDKRIDVNKLLGNVAGLLAPDVHEALSEVAQYDFDEAGKCIAFERPTAAAFHLMRGTESVLRDYYCSTVKRSRVKDLMWGPMVEHLKKKKAGAPPAGLLNNLDNIRVHFRNPTAHPEKVYDIDEAQDLFGLCVEVVNRMIRAMP